MGKKPKHVATHTKEVQEGYELDMSDGNGEEYARYNGADDEQRDASGRSGKRFPKKTVIILAVVICVLLILAEAVYLIFGHFYSKLNYAGSLSDAERAERISSYLELSDDSLEEEEEYDEDISVATEDEITDIQAQIQAALAANGGSLMSDADVVNILLIGSDTRSASERARSDVMMLVSLSKKTQKIVLTSFMRDIYTYIPDYGYNRLNVPYAIAGADYLIETLEADFGIDIDGYAAVNFYDFADVIDTLGGVDVEVTNAEVDYINKYVNGEQATLGVGTGATWLGYPSDGTAHLNGTQALSYCRIRAIGTDSGRTERQRKVISALIGQARSLSLTELYDLADTVLPMVTTDLTKADCLSLLLSASEYLSYDIESICIPSEDYYFTMINGMSVISINFSTNAAIVKEALYG